MKTTVYIPAPESPLELQIEPGSAILATGIERSDGFRPVHCEGQAFGETLKTSFADRCERGLKRMREVGSTGRRLVRATDLIPIGTFDNARGEVTIEYVQQGNMLARWLGTPALDIAELRTTQSVIEELRRDLEQSIAPAKQPQRSRPAARGWYSSR
jgi:hypothetical protein